MIVMAILSSIAFLLYFHIIKEAKRVEAQQALTEIHRLEELSLIDNNRYLDDLSVLGFKSQLKYYSVSIALNPGGFTATAAGNLDSDADLDTWTIDEKRKLVHTTKD